MIVASVLAAAAGWWAAGPPPRGVPTSSPVLGLADETALSRPVRSGLGLALGFVVSLLVPGVWWMDGMAWAVVAAGAYAALGLIAPSTADVEAARVVEMPEAMTLLACGVEAGLPLGAAVAAIAPALEGVVGDDLGRVSSGLQIGLTERDAWGALRSSESWGRVAADIGRVATSGSAVAPVLRRHEERLEKRAHDARIERARTTGVRSVFPLMTCFLPAFILVGLVPTVGGMLAGLFG